MNYLLKMFKPALLCILIFASLVSCTKDDANKIVLAESVIIDGDAILKAEEGSKIILTAKILPENVSDKKLTWLSSDPSIATVSLEGVVDCIAKGDVAIQVSTTNGMKHVISITVSAPEFVMPTELVGVWEGVEFALIDKATSDVYDETFLKEAFTTGEDAMSEAEYEAWITASRTRFSYDAAADATMNWYVKAKMTDGSIQTVKVGGFLNSKEDVANTYIGTFDKAKAGLQGGVEEHEFTVVEARIKSISSWNDNYDSMVYYKVKTAASAVNNTKSAKITAQAPIKYRKK